METRVEKTQELHDRGYNCAQAVGCAYCDLVGISEDENVSYAGRLRAGYGMHGRDLRCSVGEQLLWQA